MTKDMLKWRRTNFMKELRKAGYEGVIPENIDEENFDDSLINEFAKNIWVQYPQVIRQ